MCRERKQATYGNVSTSFGVVLTQELEVLAILKGGGGGGGRAHKFSQRGDGKSFTVLKWGRSMLQTHDIPFCSPLPVVNVQSLTKAVQQVAGLDQVGVVGRYPQEAEDGVVQGAPKHSGWALCVSEGKKGTR